MKHKGKAARGPLRRVIGYTPHPHFPGVPELVHEVYECGHTAAPKTDIFGESYAYRRRCGSCRQGRPPDVDPEAFNGWRTP